MGSTRLVVVVALWSSVARADPYVDETVRVMADAADEGRDQRIRGGIALLLIGGLSIGGGAAMIHYEDPDAWVPIGRWLGYGYVGIGALGLLAGTGILVFGESEHEKNHRELRTAIDRGDGSNAARFARTLVERKARESADTRYALRWLGVACIVLGGASIATGYAIRGDESEEGLFYGAGGLAIAGGGLMVLSGWSPDTYEDANARFVPRASLVPTREGALLSLGGRF